MIYDAEICGRIAYVYVTIRMFTETRNVNRISPRCAERLFACTNQRRRGLRCGLMDQTTTGVNRALTMYVYTYIPICTLRVFVRNGLCVCRR